MTRISDGVLQELIAEAQVLVDATPDSAFTPDLLAFKELAELRAQVARTSASLTHRILECKYCDEPYCFHCASPNVYDAENFCSAVCEEADSKEPVSESPEWVAR